MLCPKCGAQLSDSAVICRACGAMLPEQPAATQVPYPPASQPAETAASAQPNAPRTCAQCGAPLEDGVRFCTNCGAPGAGAARCRRPGAVRAAAAGHGERVLHRRGGPVWPRHLPALRQPACARRALLHRLRHARARSAPGSGRLVRTRARRHGLLAGDRPEAQAEEAAHRSAVRLCRAGRDRGRCGRHFRRRQASAPSTAGGAEVDRLIDRYFTCFENDDPDAMLDLFLPEVIAYMQDDDTVTGPRGRPHPARRLVL